MYRYIFDVYDFECAHSTVLLHETKYTNDEFIAICTECIKECLVNNLSNHLIPIMTEDGEILELQKYDDCEYVSAWTNDSYKHLDYIGRDVFKALQSKGFIYEELPQPQGRFGINEYTYIDEYLAEDVNSILNKRKKEENIPVLNYEQSSDLCEFLEANAKTLDDVVPMVKQWIESRK